MIVDPLARHLGALLANGTVSSTAVSRRDRSKLQSLFDAGVLAEERKGAGKRIVLKDKAALNAFIRATYPSGLAGETGVSFPRSRVVATLRDAKKARGGDAEVVLLRGFGEAALSSRDEVLPVADLTRKAGAAAFVLEDGPVSWRYEGVVAVVENQEVFLHFERLRVPAEIVLYAGGRLSERVIRWLSSPAMKRCEFIHCGDYDPVGLDEYLRLVRALPGRVVLHLPLELAELFARFGKRSLVEKSQCLLKRLRKSLNADVIAVVDLMDRYGVGLEQEALLIQE